MRGYGPETFGELHAESYDAGLSAAASAATAESVEFLAELAAGGTVLELAIGTGRVALPLAARGLSVHGTDASETIVAKLREKPGGDAIPVTFGDMADVPVDGTFDLIYLVFNTLFNLTSQEAQVRCFRNVAMHLNPGGAFVVETFVPDLSDFVEGQAVRGLGVTLGSARFEVVMHDPVEQMFLYRRVLVTDEGVRLNPLPMRYAWPAELDLMGQLAGLELRERWAWWDRSTFTAASKSHVSAYERPPEG